MLLFTMTSDLLPWISLLIMLGVAIINIGLLYIICKNEYTITTWSIIIINIVVTIISNI